MGFTRGSHDISATVFRRKEQLYDYALRASGSKQPLTFVAVSHWMEGLARKSPLLGRMPVEVIPNAFPTELFPEVGRVAQWRAGCARRKEGEFTVAMGAARLDDPIKGLPLLIAATRHLRDEEPELAARTRLVTFGNLRDPKAFDGIGVRHTHLGPLHGTEAVMETLRGADAVVSSSLYETLPGTLVEGQACGAIPVSFDRGGQADIIDHLHTGYIAHMEENPEQSAINLARGLAWAAETSAADKNGMPERLARSVEDNFSSQQVARRYLELFERIMA